MRHSTRFLRSFAVAPTSGRLDETSLPEHWTWRLAALCAFCIISILPTQAQQWVPDTIRLGAEGPGYVYTLPNADVFAARVDVPEGAMINGVEVTLTGDDPRGTAVVALLGSEGGAPIPRWGVDLWPGTSIMKSKPGPERVRIAAPHATLLRGGQVFIVVSDLSEGTRLVTDRRFVAPACEWGDEVFASQMIRSRGGEWIRGPFAFSVAVYVSRPASPPKPWLVDVTGSLAELDVELANRSIAVADYDHDGYNDLLAGGHLWRNMAGTAFTPVELSFGAGRDPTLHMFADVDADGILDIVAATRPDGSEVHDIVYLRQETPSRFSQPVSLGATATSPTALSIADVNGDRHPDLLISSASPGTPTAVALLSSPNDQGVRYDASSALPVGVGRGCRWLQELESTWSAAVLNASGVWHLYSVGTTTSPVESHIQDPAVGSTLAYPANVVSWSGETRLLTGHSVGAPDERGAVPVSATVHTTTGVATALPEPYLFIERQGGMASADIDGDGMLELVMLTSHPCYAVRTYRMFGDGGMEDVTLESGLAGVQAGPDALFADLDGDGAPDMLTLRNGRLSCFRNTVEQEPTGLRLSNPSAIDIYAGGRVFRIGQVSGHGQGMQQPLEADAAPFIRSSDSAVVIAADGSRHPLWRSGRSEAIADRIDQVLAEATAPVALIASPNPSSSPVRFRISGVSLPLHRIEIFDAEGVLIATLRPSATSEVVWEALDPSGKPLPSGSYTAVAHVADGSTVSERITRIR